MTVNGKLIGAPAPPGSHKQQRTYFSTITVVVDRPGRRAYIEVTPKKVILDGHDRLVLPCDATVAVQSGEVAVAVAAGANVTVTLGGTVAFVILLHRYKNPAPYQRDHVGFYISNSKGLSRDCHGLLGRERSRSKSKVNLVVRQVRNCVSPHSPNVLLICLPRNIEHIT